MRGVVKEVHPNKIVLSDGSDVPYGLLIWSTGVGPSEFVKSLNLPKSQGGRYVTGLALNFSLLLHLAYEKEYIAGLVPMNGFESHRSKMCLPLAIALDFSSPSGSPCFQL